MSAGDEGLKICGIDEAGRGAVIGPMVVAGVLIDHRRVEELVELGVKDSKKLRPEARAQLSKLIREKAERVEVVALDAETVDKSTKRSGASGLNRLEAEVFVDPMKYTPKKRPSLTDERILLTSSPR